MIVFVFLAATAPSPVAVIPVVVGDEPSAEAIVRDVGRAVETRVSLRLISSEELFVASPGLDGALADCGAAIDCIASRLRVTRARWAVVAVVNQTVEPPLVSVELVDVDVVRSVGRESKRTSDAIGTWIESSTSRLLTRAGRPPNCRLRVTTKPSDATVTVGAAVAASDGSYTLAPGEHEVVVTREAHTVKRRTAMCRAGADEAITVELEARQEPLVHSPWLWGAIGVVVAVGVVATVVVAQPGPPCICAGPPGAVCSNCP